MPEDEKRKDLIFVVKRGRGAEYTQLTLTRDPFRQGALVCVLGAFSFTDTDEAEVHPYPGTGWQAFLARITLLIRVEAEPLRDANHLEWPSEYLQEPVSDAEFLLLDSGDE